MKAIVVLTGAGISAESGLRTFRDSDGLWEDHSIEEIATFDAWRRDPEKVLRFYDERREQIINSSPNLAHKALAKLDQKFHVNIITQNIDDLHQRAGSSSVLHLHGEIRKSRSTSDPLKTYDVKGSRIKIGDLCEDGSQLRPHVVWFGESVPMLEQAIEITKKADLLIIIGTSLLVYPASSLVDYAFKSNKKYYIDPKANINLNRDDFELISKKAVEGVVELVDKLMLDQE